MVLAANSRRVGGSYVKSLTKRTTNGFPRKLNSSRWIRLRISRGRYVSKLLWRLRERRECNLDEHNTQAKGSGWAQQPGKLRLHTFLYIHKHACVCLLSVWAFHRNEQLGLRPIKEKLKCLKQLKIQLHKCYQRLSLWDLKSTQNIYKLFWSPNLNTHTHTMIDLKTLKGIFYLSLTHPKMISGMLWIMILFIIKPYQDRSA